MTHHNQTRVLTTWFLKLPLDESIDNKKHKVWILNPRHNEAQLEDQKPRKAQEGHLEEGKKMQGQQKARKAANQEKWQRRTKISSKPKQNEQEKLKLENSPWIKLPPKHSQCKLSPLGRYYHDSSLNHPISKSSTNFVHILSPFDNELIKHKPREEWDVMHEIKIRVLHKIYKQLFE
jgi:hypothetical protein